MRQATQNCISARRHASHDIPVSRVNHAGAHREIRTRRGPNRRERSFIIHDREPARNAAPLNRIESPQLQVGLLDGFGWRTIIQPELAHEDVVRAFWGDDGENVFAVPE